jgi:hypothetical protein
METTIARLDRRACAHVPLLLTGVPKLLVPDNLKSRRQSFVLRSGDQPNLWRDGGALFGWHLPRAAGKAEGQGDCFIPQPIRLMAA